MSAIVLKFPRRGPFCVRVEPEAAGGWLVIAPSHGWLHSDHETALRDAHEIANGFGVAVVSSS
jgi:hypothetical protein